MAPPRRKPSSTVPAKALVARANWKPLPAVVVLGGPADYFKERIIKRFSHELFGDAAAEMRRFQGAGADAEGSGLPLSTVLDELRTPSFFSPKRLVVVDGGDAFLAEHHATLAGFVEKGFAGGHLIVSVAGKPDGRTRFAKVVAAHGWIVQCAQPFDRPPPWDGRTPIWDSELSHWLVERAREKGVELDPKTAFVLHDRAGTDLRALDDEIEKISTLLAQRGKTRIDEATVREVCGDLREDSIFNVVDLFLEGRRRDSLVAGERLFDRGYHDQKGAAVRDSTSIAILLTGAMVSRLRALRRAHAMAADGATSDDWIRERLVLKPFLERFQRQLRATSPARIPAILDRLYRSDRLIKRGGDARRLTFLVMAE